MALVFLEALLHSNVWKPWVWNVDASMKRLFALMGFLLALGASSRVFGLDSEYYELKSEPVSCTTETYEAVYD